VIDAFPYLGVCNFSSLPSFIGVQVLRGKLKGLDSMKSSKMIRRGSFLLILLMIVLIFPASVTAAQPPVNLGTTESFAVLAGTTITNTGTTTINGDAGGNVGLFPGTAFTGQETATISGAIHLNNDVASKAKDDLVIAYDDAAGRTPVSRISSELGGMNLKPGIYDSADGTFQITGTLTLDADGDPEGVFIFLTSSTLITASDSNVSLLNSARYCRIFWKVGSSATLGTNSNFVGHIFALTSIAAQTGATVQGQLLARNGEVTLDSNTITNGFCAAAAPTSEETAAAATTAAPTPAETAVAETANTITPAGDTTETTITKTGEASNSAFMVIGPIMLCLAGIIFLALQISQKRAGTVMPNSDYRASDRKK